MWQNMLINTQLLICLFSPSLSPQHLYGRHCSFMVRAAVYHKKPKQDQKLKKFTSKKPLHGFMQTQPARLQLLRGSFLSIMILFAITILVIINLPVSPRSISEYSANLRSKSWWTGLSTKVQPGGLSVNILSSSNLRVSLATGQVRGGPTSSFLNTQLFVSVNPLGSIPSMVNVSTKQILINILMSWRRSWRQRESHGVMYTMWMRKVVSKVEGGGCTQLNSSYLILISPTTNSAVQTCSSRPSLSVFVQMVLHSHLDLSFQGNNFMKSGLLIFQKVFGKCFCCKIV